MKQNKIKNSVYQLINNSYGVNEFKLYLCYHNNAFNDEIIDIVTVNKYSDSLYKYRDFEVVQFSIISKSKIKIIGIKFI